VNQEGYHVRQTYVEHMLERMETETETETITDNATKNEYDFDVLWARYPRKLGKA